MDETNIKFYRQVDLERLFLLMKGGESASIVGISGIGKSNFFNELLKPEAHQLFLGDDSRNFYIVRVNCHYLPDFSDRSIYSLILEQFENLNTDFPDGLEIITADEIKRNHEALLDSADDQLKIQRFFKLAIRALIHSQDKHLVILLDQFDDIFRDAASTVFMNLRGLRENYKYRLSFITFSRDILPRIADLDPGREEFYELFESNVLWLKPYNRVDASRLLKRLAERYKLQFDGTCTDKYYPLTGGHAGLLRATFIESSRAQLGDIKALDLPEIMISRPPVLLECQKIWNSISAEEKKLLTDVTRGNKLSRVPELQAILTDKGLLVADGDNNNPHIFSPILTQFIEKQEPLWEDQVYLDEVTHTVWILGKPTQLLTAQEYRLFKMLYKRKNEVISKDELVEAGWPNSKGGVSDEALMVTVSRMRKKIEPDPENPRIIENVREHGYRLNSDI